MAGAESDGGGSVRRRRDARVNDALILDAALDLAADEGWAGLAFPRLSAATGLSLPPLRSRFADRAELAAELWEQRIAEPFVARLQAVVDAVPAPSVEGDWQTTAMLEAMRHFEQPDARLRAASELLVMARVELALGAAIDASLREFAHETLGSERVSPAQAARHAFALAEALGLLLLSRDVAVPVTDVQQPLQRMVRAMSMAHEPRDLPRERAEHLDLGAVFATGDPAWDALLQATLNEVGARGFDAATLDIIAHAAGYSRGIIQNRYPSKKAVFLDATRRMLAAAVLLNEDYKTSLGRRYSPGMADAALMREFMDPDRRLVRSISFEQMRMAWHDPEVAEVMRAEVRRARGPVDGVAVAGAAPEGDGAWHFGLALGQGAGLLADLMPRAASLPFDVVFMPLHDLDDSITE